SAGLRPSQCDSQLSLRTGDAIEILSWTGRQRTIHNRRCSGSTDKIGSESGKLIREISGALQHIASIGTANPRDCRSANPGPNLHDPHNRECVGGYGVTSPLRPVVHALAIWISVVRSAISREPI